MKLAARRSLLMASLCAAAVLATAAPASGATIGQLAPAPAPACVFGVEFVQPTVTSGNPYVVPPGFNTITSWSTSATAGNGQGLKFKVYRRVAAGTETFKVVAHSGPFILKPSSVNTFPANIAVEPGDVIGVAVPLFSAANVACAFNVPGDSNNYFNGDLDDGGSGPFISNSNSRINATAEVAYTPTGAREAALKKCKKKKSNKKRKKCRKAAKKLPE
jgi:hypothetical protein